jgi:hypothetical protein
VAFPGLRDGVECERAQRVDGEPVAGGGRRGTVVGHSSTILNRDETTGRTVTGDEPHT